MTEQELSAPSLKLTEEEREEIRKALESSEDEEFKQFLERMSSLVRAFEGKPIDSTDIITKLTNVKDILERSRFPNYGLLAKQVYLRLIHKYIEGAEPCLEWADLEAKALISYKGQSRSEYVEMTKSASNNPQQEFVFGSQRVQDQQPIKRRFWSRKPKEEVTEFTEQ